MLLRKAWTYPGERSWARSGGGKSLSFSTMLAKNHGPSQTSHGAKTLDLLSLLLNYTWAPAVSSGKGGKELVFGTP